MPSAWKQSWARHSFVWSVSAIGFQQVPFLDACYSFENGRVTTKLYQKPLNLYHYVPRASRHHQNVFRSVAYSEYLRLCRRCTHWRDRQHFAGLLRQRLLRRGYLSSEITSAFQRARHKFQNPTPHLKPSSGRKCFLRVGDYNSGLNLRFIQRVIKKHCKVHGAIVTPTFRVQKNLFRLLYHSTWCNSRSGEAGRARAFES